MKNLNENDQIMKKIIKIFYTISTLSSNGPQTLAWHIFNMGRKSFFFANSVVWRMTFSQMQWFPVQLYIFLAVTLDWH